MRRERYIVEYQTCYSWCSSETWFPRFFETKDEALRYVKRMIPDFGKNWFKYRLKKETVAEETLEEGEYGDGKKL